MRPPWIRTSYHCTPPPFLDFFPSGALVPDSDCIPRSLHLASAQILSFYSKNKTNPCPTPPFGTSERPYDDKVTGDPGKPPARLKERRRWGRETRSWAQNGHSVGFFKSCLPFNCLAGKVATPLGCLPVLLGQRGWQAGAGREEGAGQVPGS